MSRMGKPEGLRQQHDKRPNVRTGVSFTAEISNDPIPIYIQMLPPISPKGSQNCTNATRYPHFQPHHHLFDFNPFVMTGLAITLSQSCNIVVFITLIFTSSPARSFISTSYFVIASLCCKDCFVKKSTSFPASVIEWFSP